MHAAPPDQGHGQWLEHVVKAVEIGVDDAVPVLVRQGRKGPVTGDASVNAFHGRAEKVIQIRDVHGDLNIS